MSEAKFTKGPWQWVNGETDEAWNGVDLVISGPSLRTVEYFDTISNNKLPKFVIDFDEGMEYMDPDDAANANLIAAAPEMYAMLQFLADNDSINDSSIDKEVLALLAKARGET